MLCAWKDDVFEFVRFDGLDSALYPDWFNELVRNKVVVHDVNSYIYFGDKRTHNVELGDVFIVNARKEVMYVPCWQFTDHWFEVN